MPTGINVGSGRNRETDLDKILKGLTIANQAFGVYSNIDKIRENAQQRDLNRADLKNKEVATDIALAKEGFREAPSLLVSDAPKSESELVSGAPSANPVADVPKPKEYQIGGKSYVGGPQEKAQNDAVRELVKSYDADPTTKRTAQVIEGYKKLMQSVNNPGQYGVADIATIYSWFHIVEPTSTVKDGEFKVAENASGQAKQMANILNKIMSGSYDRGTIKDFGRVGGLLLQGQLDAQKNLVDKRYEKESQRIGADPSAVVNPYFKEIDDELRALKAPKGGGRGASSAAKSSTPKAGDIQDGHRFKGGDPGDAKNWEKM